MPGSFDDLPDQPSRPKRSWGQFFYRYRWCVLLLLLPLLFGSSIVTGLRHFVAERLLSNAEMQRERDQLPEALASVNRALFWEPKSSDCWQEYLIRSEIFEEMRDLKASCDDLSQAIELLNDPGRSEKFPLALAMAYQRRSRVFERLGKHQEAIADSTSALDIAPANMHSTLLNERAYVRALANRELDEALQDINRSLATAPEEAAFIDTRAYVRFRLGQYPAALEDIEKAIRLTKRLNRFLIFGDNGPRVEPQGGRISPREVQIDLAVMYHHRGEIRKKLGQTAEGEQDIRNAENMGYDPANGVY